MKSYNTEYVKFAYPSSNLNEKIQTKGELEQSQAFLFGLNKKVLSKNYIESKIGRIR